jgi:peptidoglycan hydrolase CwlO-like protein
MSEDEQLAQLTSVNTQLLADLAQLKAKLNSVSLSLVKPEVTKSSRIIGEQTPGRMAMHGFLRNTETQLKLLKKDKLMLRHKLDRLDNPETLTELAMKIGSKEAKLKQLKRANKGLQLKLRGTTKSLGGDQSPENVTAP